MNKNAGRYVPSQTPESDFTNRETVVMDAGPPIVQLRVAGTSTESSGYGCWTIIIRSAEKHLGLGAQAFAVEKET